MSLGRAVKSIRTKLRLRYYRARLKEPLDPNLAIFAAYFYRGYTCNPRAIYEAAMRLTPGFRGVWAVEGVYASSMPPGVPYVIRGTREYFDLLARASLFVNNVNFPTYVVKRPGTVHVMTHHGTPLKHMGLDLEGKPIPEGRQDFNALRARCSRWDFSVSSNAHSTEIWKRVYPGSYESLDVGYPRNDVLHQATNDDYLRIRSTFQIPERKKVMLYAPTHRDADERFVPRLDLASLAESLGSDWIILSRKHHFYDREATDNRDANRIIDVSKYPRIEDLCIASDALCTDYSSIMFDYAILNRPIVIFAPDWEDYKKSRGVYFDIISDAPGLVFRTQSELASGLLDNAPWDVPAQNSLGDFRAKFCTFGRGDAADRVVLAAQQKLQNISGLAEQVRLKQ